MSGVYETKSGVQGSTSTHQTQGNNRSSSDVWKELAEKLSKLMDSVNGRFQANKGVQKNPPQAQVQKPTGAAEKIKGIADRSFQIFKKAAGAALITMGSLLVLPGFLLIGGGIAVIVKA